MTKKFNISDIYKDIDDLEEDYDDSSENPSDEEVLLAIPNQSSTKLADVVISFRYLGLYKDLSIAAMEELVKRRLAGDEFKFEQYIDDNLKSLPKLEFKLPNLDNILKSFEKLKNESTIN